MSLYLIKHTDMRTEEMITKDMMMCKQILPTSTMRSIWKTMRRICMLILGLKGLNIGDIKVCVCVSVRG